MAQVKCNVCGRTISTTDEYCPYCGHWNGSYDKSEHTPRTIRELQEWYDARNLPPAETTRFFIGQNYKGPRAFGIYEDNGIFIVYKNKDTGQRAIRYSGPSEADAVNELYLKLKDEIANQKSRYNLDNNQSTKRSRPKYQNNSSRNRRKIPPIVVIFILFMFGPSLIMFPISCAVTIGILLSNDKFSSSTYYYDIPTKSLYYNYGLANDGYELWQYDKDVKDWNIEGYYKKEKEYPKAISNSNCIELDNLNKYFNSTHKYLDITTSHNYLDVHHPTPSTSYYYIDDQYYYYIDDTHSSYGTQNNSGWYIYENDDWRYYCDEDNKLLIGDELWYNPKEYSVYNVNSVNTSNIPTNFEGTEWYKSHLNNNKAYDDYASSHNTSSSSWDNDSSYDWDSSSDWDSGWSDWDSDW